MPQHPGTTRADVIGCAAVVKEDHTFVVVFGQFLQGGGQHLDPLAGSGVSVGVGQVGPDQVGHRPVPLAEAGLVAIEGDADDPIGIGDDERQLVLGAEESVELLVQGGVVKLGRGEEIQAASVVGMRRRIVLIAARLSSSTVVVAATTSTAASKALRSLSWSRATVAIVAGQAVPGQAGG